MLTVEKHLETKRQVSDFEKLCKNVVFDIKMDWEL